MKIKISSLKDGAYEYFFEDDIKKIGLEAPFIGNYKTIVDLSTYDDQIILKVSTSINAELECDRCAKLYPSRIESSYKMVYLHEEIDGDNDSVDVTYISKDTDMIDISEDVREYSLLAVPMKKLCKEDCKGLCLKCGNDLNKDYCGCKKEEVDIRWKPLLELKNKLN